MDAAIRAFLSCPVYTALVNNYSISHKDIHITAAVIYYIISHCLFMQQPLVTGAYRRRLFLLDVDSYINYINIVVIQLITIKQ